MYVQQTYQLIKESEDRRRRDSLNEIASNVSREADTFDRLFLVSLKVKPRDESRQTGGNRKADVV